MEEHQKQMEVLKNLMSISSIFKEIEEEAVINGNVLNLKTLTEKMETVKQSADEVIILCNEKGKKDA